jgi:transcriptional regulator with XRE-family HTH domain
MSPGRPWSAERIKDFRHRRGWTQEELAQRVGVAPNTIARIESGNRRPSLGLLERLARTLNVDLARLFR